MEEVEARKDVVCYRCGSKEVTAYFYIANDGRPAVSFDCAKCKEHGQPTPIMGVRVDTDALSSIFDMEEIWRKK